ERQAGAELEGAARKRRTGDLPDSRTSDAGVRNAQARVVESVGRIKPELKLTALQFRNAQGLAGREVDVGIPRSTQDVPALVAEFVLARRYESGRVEPLSGGLGIGIQSSARHH